MGAELVDAEAVIRTLFYGLVFIGVVCVIAIIVMKMKQKS